MYVIGENDGYQKRKSSILILIPKNTSPTNDMSQLKIVCLQM
jgi:hypothetical protein